LRLRRRWEVQATRGSLAFFPLRGGVSVLCFWSPCRN